MLVLLKTPLLYLLLCMVAAFSCSAKETKVRIVLITLDTLRLDGVSTPGQAPMSATRQWSKKGLNFRRFYTASSTTQPSHATLFTGLHPWQHGVTRNGQVLSSEYETLAERLSDAGFRTAAVVASFPVHGQFGFDQGFDLFFDEFREDEVENWGGVERDDPAFYSQADFVSKEAHESLDRLGGEKQFFWFHFFDAHSPYGDTNKSGGTMNHPDITDGVVNEAKPPGRLCRRAHKLYEDDLRFLDHQLDILPAAGPAGFNRTPHYRTLAKNAR
jgi:hypothetical protein